MLFPFSWWVGVVLAIMANPFPDCFFLSSQIQNASLWGTVYHLLNCFCLPPPATACFVSSLGCNWWHFSLLLRGAHSAKSCPAAFVHLSAKSNCRAVQLSNAHSNRARSWGRKWDKIRLASNVENSCWRTWFQFKGHFCFDSSKVQFVMIRGDYATQYSEYCHWSRVKL